MPGSGRAGICSQCGSRAQTPSHQGELSNVSQGLHVLGTPHLPRHPDRIWGFGTQPYVDLVLTKLMG